MQKLKRPFSFILLIMVFFVTTGLGCKGLSPEQQQATQPVTLEYWTVFDDVDALQSLIDNYKLSRPYLNINLRQLRQDEIYPRLVEALSEDKGPDIVSVSNRDVRAWQTKLAPMPASVRDTTVLTGQGGLKNETVVNTSVRNLMNINQLDREYVQTVGKDAVIGGQIYGLPLSLDTMAIYYNKDLLDRSGVPEPPKNWEEFQEAVKKITRYDKTSGKILQSGTAFGTGNNITGSDDLLYILYRQSGLDFIKNNNAVFNTVPQGFRGGDTPSMAVLNFYTDYANTTRDTYSWNESMDNSLDRFVSGSVGFFFGYSYHYAQIKARAPQLNFSVVPLLQLNPEKPFNAANYWLQGVTLKSRHQNEAWAFVDYIAHSKATKEYLDKTGRPTALRVYISEQNSKPELAPFVSQVLVADNWYRGGDYKAAAKVVNDMIHEWLLPPSDPDRVYEIKQEILNRAAAKVNQTM